MQTPPKEHLRFTGLRRQAHPAFPPAALNHIAPAGRRHPRAKTMIPFAPEVRRLKRPLHNLLLLNNLCRSVETAPRLRGNSSRGPSDVLLWGTTSGVPHLFLIQAACVRICPRASRTAPGPTDTLIERRSVHFGKCQSQISTVSERRLALPHGMKRPPREFVLGYK